MSVLAIDLGSSSARVMLVDKDYNSVELGRYAHEPTKIGGNYRFDTDTLFDYVISVVDKAIDENEIESIGICSWGVDYGLIEECGALVDLPISYRDNRTKEIFNSRDILNDYKKSGIYPMNINTVYQLLADIKSGRLKRTYKMVMIADLLAYKLTGSIKAERSNASTTGLLALDGKDWNFDYINSIGIPREIFPDIVDTRECYGDYRGVKVVAVPTHDTAAAIYAMGEMDENTAFISSGSWILLGKLLKSPIVSDDAFNAGYTNERGYGNEVTFLKNINGLYVVQRIVAETGLSYKEIDREIDGAKSLGLLDLNKLDSPQGICDMIKSQLGIKHADDISLVRTAYDSIADTVAKSLTQLAELTDSTITKVLLTGGMARAPYLMNKFRELSGTEIVVVGNEGAILGNAKAQYQVL